MNQIHGRIVWCCIGLIVGIILGMTLPGAIAHPGGLAADGCHKHKAAGERHFHFDGTSERGGECVQRDGRTIQVAPPEARIAELRNAERAARSQLAAVKAEAGRDVRRARAEAASARAEADEARAEADEARAAAEDAQRRAAGHGPRVDRRCRTAVRNVVHADTDWTGDVEVDAEGRAALTRACLES